MHTWAYHKKGIFHTSKNKGFSTKLFILQKTKDFQPNRQILRKINIFFRKFLNPVTSKVCVVEKRAMYENYSPIYELLDNIHHLVSQ